METLKKFGNHFQKSRHDPVLDEKTTPLQVKNFRATGSALKRKHPGRPRCVRTPENIQIVKEFVLRSSSRSAYKHSAALRLSVRCVTRISHSNFKFHPYKLMVA